MVVLIFDCRAGGHGCSVQVVDVLVQRVPCEKVNPWMSSELYRNAAKRSTNVDIPQPDLLPE